MPDFIKANNVTISGGTFNQNERPVIITDNSRHITRNGPTYHNWGPGTQTINQVQGYGYNPHNSEVTGHDSFAIVADFCVQGQRIQLKGAQWLIKPDSLRVSPSLQLWVSFLFKLLPK